MPRIVAYSAITAGAVVDPGVWSADCASYRINDTQGIRARWGLMTGGTDPRWPFANCDGSIETQGPSAGVTQSLATTSEAGLFGPDAVMRFGKVTDPDSPGKFAYLLRRKQGDEGTLKRTELSFSTTFTPVPLGAACWIGFAIRVPSAWRGMTGTDEVMVWQVHETPDGGDDTQEAPIGMTVRGNRMLMWVRSNPNATTLEASTTYAEVFSESVWPGDVWQFWAVKLVSHWTSSGQSPHLEAWRRIGSGATVKVVDHAGPNSYNNAVRDYAKSGLYYYAEQWTGGLTDKVMHHKGIYQWLAGQGLDQESILDYLQAI